MQCPICGLTIPEIRLGIVYLCPKHGEFMITDINRIKNEKEKAAKQAAKIRR